MTTTRGWRIARTIGKHKALEGALEWDSDSTHMLDVGVIWRRRCDHAGIEVRLAVWRFNFFLFFYDGRHWNEAEGRPMTDAEAEQQWLMARLPAEVGIREISAGLPTPQQKAKPCLECGRPVGAGACTEVATGRTWCSVWCALGVEKPADLPKQEKIAHDAT